MYKFNAFRFMKRSQGISAFLVATCVWSSLMSFPLTASAAGCVSGQLIRARILGLLLRRRRQALRLRESQDLQHLVFGLFHGPHDHDAALASVPLGGNVTYKPGTRLVKITTDPTVYALIRRRTARHRLGERATQLYGSAWNKSVDDIPDAFFVNYHVGAAITSAPSSRDRASCPRPPASRRQGLAAAGTFDTPSSGRPERRR